MNQKSIAIVKGRLKVCAGYLSGYKKPCLYIYTLQNCIRKVATFTDHEAAQVFMDYLAVMMGAEREEE